MNNWFEVSKEGLKALQAGKSKTFIINELVQNGFDEEITQCKVDIIYGKDITEIRVSDDSPEGFKNISHAYTLYADTYKRQDPTKRGRFNLGEKQVIAICEKAFVETTKGTIIFDENGRHESDIKTDHGSIITIWVKLNRQEHDELLNHTKTLLVPSHIKFIVNDEIIKSKPVLKSFNCSLLTEILENDVMRQRWRQTQVDLVSHNDDISYIYEMGIPITSTDCPWHINVQQKIILNIDRDNINGRYLKDLYSKVLNNAYDDVEEAESSSLWVRTAMKAKTTIKEAVENIMTKRYGEKHCIANPSDKHSVEDAISHGYNVIYGSEMSKEEWSNVKEQTDIQSTSQLFGHNEIAAGKVVTDVTTNMKQFVTYAKNIGNKLLGINIKVIFVDVPDCVTIADYNREAKVFRVNIGHKYIRKGFFDKPISDITTKLIIHELSHEEGKKLGHIDYTYQEMQSTLGAKLTMLALKEPEFFEVK